ncbi:hypothetical protein H310_02749 [Aphanomyces invadans]|uniref:Uncharacterized protein n=1 Tax=Aphanomyces invadans TaxID=157072 RepID=A0A024ULN6_9STRA|nr:hypothetical protein H310_02749 [Aphanomyces invadans]ETW06518.1 hypothetical protein H310_02749 [Aphanomyces invadans]|eukprot:XP_008864593.1 hypothetical protein H310_02749 [Aphanomyces invadans]
MKLGTVLASCAAWWAANFVVKEACHTSSLKGEEWIAELLHGNPRRFRNQLRMLPGTFLALLDMLQTKYTLKSSRFVSAREKLATFLYVVGQAGSNRGAQERFQRSGWTITQSINEVLNAFMLLYPIVVTLPSNDIPYEVHSNPKMYPFFEHCIGALDGTHVRATPPSNARMPFRNRKGFMSQNVLAACTFNLRFVYVLAGWEGSASDARVLNDALLTKGFFIPEGKMYLGDAGYGLRTNLLTPYRGVRYHLREWAQGNQSPQNSKELYNLRHAQQRNCVERIFGVLKKRFKILEHSSEYPFKTQVNLVYALCALHNIIMELESDPHFLQKADKAKKKRDKKHQQRMARRGRPNNRRRPDHNAEDHTAEAGALRDSIAVAMWQQYTATIQSRQ